ncbi:MAG: type IV secretory system conjugative DNA transfer family protein [Ruminococcus sp.]|nr:type IV secretory system conjugative DNA transfer family protein [Ruminococcus sp.]
MNRFIWIKVLLFILLGAAIYVLLFGWTALPTPSIAILLTATAVAALVIANEMRRPAPKEQFRKKALFPKIPEKFLASKPQSGSIIFGKDYHTHKTVVSEVGHHVLLCGSTGSGKTATCLLPSILNYDGTGSLQIVDIKSRELSYKSADVFNENTQIVDLNLRKPYVYGWDLLYKLKKDGTDTEQAVLDVVKEIAYVIVPRSKSGDSFWNDAARNEFIGLFLYEYIYGRQTEFIDIVTSMMNIPLREHLESALNGSPKTSLIASYLTSLASSADETLFSVDLTLSQNLYPFVSEDAVYFFRDNKKRANPTALNQEGVKQYLCVDEHKLDSGYDKFVNIIMKQTLQELQSRTASGSYAQCTLIWDEWQRLTDSCLELRSVTSSFLKTGRSKHASVVLCVQNLDGFDKQLILDILSNIHYFYVLASNNSESFTTEVVTKMAGSYYEKEQSHSEGRGTSISTSFREKSVLKPEDLNRLGDDAVLIITNHGYVRSNKEATAYYKTEPYKSKYEKILAVNKTAMDGV